MIQTLQPGAYTAILTGKNQTTGVGLVEVYDNDQAGASQLANLSTRGFVQTGNNVMIGGFILGGDIGDTQVAIRGIGPSLTQSGLSNVLADPTLELHDSNGTTLVSNDNWQDNPASALELSVRGLALHVFELLFNLARDFDNAPRGRVGMDLEGHRVRLLTQPKLRRDQRQAVRLPPAPSLGAIPPSVLTRVG